MDKDSLIRERAKQIVAEEGSVRFPQLDLRYKWKTMTLFTERYLDLDVVHLDKVYEYGDGSTFTADISTLDDDVEIIIMLKTQEGLLWDMSALESRKTLILEIDLTQVDADVEPEVLYDRGIESVDNKRWLYHPHELMGLQHMVGSVI